MIFVCFDWDLLVVVLFVSSVKIAVTSSTPSVIAAIVPGIRLNMICMNLNFLFCSITLECF